MGLTDAKTWDEAAVFVIAELGSLKKRLDEVEVRALGVSARSERVSSAVECFEDALNGVLRRSAVLEEETEETNKRLDTFRQAVDYEGIEARFAALERKQEGDVGSLTTQIADLEADQKKLTGRVEVLAAGKAVFTIEREIDGYSPSTPTQPTEMSQYSPFCAKPCLNKAKAEEQKQTEAGQVAALQKMLAESEARTTEKLVELHEADLVNKALEARVLELESLARKEVGSTDNAWRRVTELEVERNLAKARISAITDKLRSLVTQLRVQNTTAPHWRSDTAVGAYRHSANLLETALIELALVEAPADSVHAAKEHAESLARMLEAGTPVQVDMKPQPALLMTVIAPCDYAFGIHGKDRDYANVFRNYDGSWTADFGQDQSMQSLERDTLPGVMRALNQITGRYYQLPSGAVPYCK